MKRLRVFALPLVAALGCTAVHAAALGYSQKNLVSDGAVPANVIDANLKNPWGISFSPTSPFWVADNGTGLSTLYRGDGSIVPLVVTIPPAPGSPPPGVPTGTVFNANNSGATPDFLGDRFLFATEDGVIAGWQGGTNASVRADNSASGAVYKGLAIGGGNIYATDFANNRIDVWNDGYTPLSLGATAFTDPNLPSGFAPFGIQNINGTLYVTYAMKQPGGDDDVPGPGNGFVDTYDLSGNLLMRLIVGMPGDPNSPLNSPWGLAMAPAGFGPLGNLLLVGNFGDGRINAFDPTTGAFVSSVNHGNGTPIVNDGLWGLAFGNGANGFNRNSLYFTAGLNDEADGLFGVIITPEPGTFALAIGGLAAAILFRRRRA
jgi:uncharacterized protein (TIGR03118 family)